MKFGMICTLNRALMIVSDNGTETEMATPKRIILDLTLTISDGDLSQDCIQEIKNTMIADVI